MHQTIRRHRLTAVDSKFRSVEAADLAAGFFHDEHARSRVPGIEIKFPETVEATASHIAQIEGGRSRAPHAVSAQRNLVVKMNIRILVPLTAGKAGREQALLQLRRFRNVDRLAVELRASSLLRGE